MQPACTLSVCNGASPRPMMNSVLPPPTSMTSRGSREAGRSCATPRKMSRPSSRPETISTGWPSASSAAPRKLCGDASRLTVLVATARTLADGRLSMRWPKRARLASARARWAASSVPSERKPAARRTVSRKRSITRGSPCSMRATTMWKLFEPRSTAAISSPSLMGTGSVVTRGFQAGKATILPRRPRGAARRSGRAASCASAADLFQQRLLRAVRRLVAGRGAGVAAVAAEQPGLGVVGQAVGQCLVEHALGQDRVEDRERHLDAAHQVAFHPVGAGAVDLRLVVVGEPVHAAVLEEPPDDRAHADAFGDARQPGPERAGAAYDQVDLHAGLRGA